MGKLRIMLGLAFIGLLTLLWKAVLLILVIAIPIVLIKGVINRRRSYGKWN